MRTLRAAGLVGLMALAVSAQAQTIATSPRPDDVDVTVYRDPNRSPGQEPDLRMLNGYALISERRQVTIPAGESDIRFEGVAGGIIPQSAIVTGFPDGIVERNRDAYLLSPATLLDRSLGRRVHLRRTSLATGETRNQEAIIRSSADGAVVFQTRDGFEALRCSGLPETPVYESVPAGLSARPTLSVRARTAQPVTATVTLSYLATGFDWKADYIANLSPDGTRIDLFAWLTLASMDETSFPNADTQAVAGRLNREAAERIAPEGGALQLRCWPQARTSDIPLEQPDRRRARLAAARGAEDVVVTGSRLDSTQALASVTAEEFVMASLEDLGDLKLYRIPEPVTVAANSQKQVAFLQRSGVEISLVHRRTVAAGQLQEPQPARRVLVTRNQATEGLGIPLPAGQLRLFAVAGERPILIGQGSLDDRAIGEDVEVEIGDATGIMTRVERTADRTGYRLVVTNDRSEPVRFEAEFLVEAEARFRPRARLSRRDGRPLWATDVPANGTATLTYRLTERKG